LHAARDARRRRASAELNDGGNVFNSAILEVVIGIIFVFLGSEDRADPTQKKQLSVAS
jgi:hypothetical protein